ncbi:nitrogen permease regulator 2-like protein [Entomortierella parvispora]|uniref:Nitrogen permease regulator 2-like protein n=1 Tax=Entomortierella parvispora TaxID=205924 RepID=A0A9P3H111_9FUNG|nr:nitrogen permease regulator 2-like protein [Entomortierella parvispora]
MGFPRLLSIFYCTFHPIQGPKVLYEVPEGSILSKTSPLVDFDSISEYLIPKVELCSKLVTISTPTCKVIGFPINLEHKKFQRNALMFNLAFVFDKDAEISSYEPVVRKMARVLKALEKENEFLSKQTRLLMMDHPASVNNPAPSLPPTPAETLLQNSSTAATTATTVATASTTSGATPALVTATAPTAVPSSTTTAATENAEKTEKSEKTDKTEKVEIISSPEPANGESDSKGASGTLTPPIDISPNTSILPTALPPLPSDGSTITSTVLVSSPPFMSSNSISAIITAPPSSSPFPISKSSSSGSNNSTGGVSHSAPNSLQKTVASSTSTSAAAPTLLELAQTNGSGMQNLIEQLIEDLNSYCECQIPIDSANTINLKLFPTYTNPAPVYDYQVPISTVNLEALTDVNWDMTMQRITGYINGVNSVKRIAEYADVETGLARMCMQHLLYYGCIIMVDLFQFKNIYAVKLEMMRLTEDVALQCECVSYVTLPDMHAPSFAKIFSLYCSLQYGVVLQDWIEQNQIADYNIDVRRFISFGVIKGFLYRVHKYPILDSHDPNSETGTGSKAEQESNSIAPFIPGSSNQNGEVLTPGHSATAATTAFPATAAVPSISSRPGTPSATITSTQRKIYGDTLAPTDQNTYNPQSQQQSSHDAPQPSVVIPPALRRLLNGQHHYDELCTQFGCSVREMDLILATDSRVKFIYR